MAISEIILKGRKHRFCYDSTPGAKKWYRLSYWTHASDVEFDNGMNLDEQMKGKADILTVNKTVYVSENGNDSGDGSKNNPWRTIQHAINSVPVINGNYEYKISIESGAYNGFVAKSISATIELKGDVVITDSNIYPIEIDDSNIKITGEHTLSVNGGNGSILYIHNSGKVNIFKTIIKLTGNGDGKGIYLISDGGFSQTNARISFDHLNTAVNVGTNSVFYSDEMYGSYITNGIIAESGGHAAYDKNNISAVNPIITNSGGRVFTGSQE